MVVVVVVVVVLLVIVLIIISISSNINNSSNSSNNINIRVTVIILNSICIWNSWICMKFFKIEWTGHAEKQQRDINNKTILHLCFLAVVPTVIFVMYLLVALVIIIIEV